MANDLTRRRFLEAAGAAAVVGAAAKGLAKDADGGPGDGKVKIVGICCSPRKGKTTAASLTACLAAAAKVDGRIGTELIELAGLAIPGGPAAGVAVEAGQKDDFPAVAAKLVDPSVRGIVIGTPVYFSNMSYLCKAFLDRCMVFRKNFDLADRVGAVLAIGAARNGGQEVTIMSVLASLFCHDMVVVGAARPTSRFGAAVWGKGGNATEDKMGMAAAANLGQRVAKVALALAGPGKAE